MQYKRQSPSLPNPKVTSWRVPLQVSTGKALTSPAGKGLDSPQASQCFLNCLEPEEFFHVAPVIPQQEGSESPTLLGVWK